MRLLQLPLKENPYTIHIGSQLLTDPELIKSYCTGEKVLIVSNDVVAPLYIEQLQAVLQGKKIQQMIIPDGEIYKNREQYFNILDFLVEQGYRRNDTLLALGGGVVGDLSGFVAASYQRGMNYLQIPTSLLAQVDSSVGGKTAINHQSGKNLIGAFYQPVAVVIDVNCLSTLPDREYFSGFGEIVKYALLGEKQIAKLLFDNIDKIKRRDEACLTEIIYLSCQKKAAIVAKDEKEKGERALLNLGHTFAHAVETLTEYKRYLHGEAVAIGIMMALSFSVKRSLISQQMLENYQRLMTQLHLPIKADVVFDVDAFLLVMSKDKKNQSDAYRLVLVADDHCILQEETDRALLAEIIKEYSLAC